MPKEKTIRLNGRDIPCKDVISIRPVIDSDGYSSELTYRLFEPTYRQPLPSKDREHAARPTLQADQPQ